MAVSDETRARGSFSYERMIMNQALSLTLVWPQCRSKIRERRKKREEKREHILNLCTGVVGNK